MPFRRRRRLRGRVRRRVRARRRRRTVGARPLRIGYRM